MALALTACAAFTSCGVRVYSEKDKVSRTLTVNSEINEIVTLATTDIEFREGSASFTLFAPESHIDKIEIFVENGKLIVTNKEIKGNQNTWTNNNTHSKLVVSYPSVNKFTTSGTGDIDIDNLDVKELTLRTYGTGDIELKSGRCIMFNAETAGTGDIELGNINCTNAYLTSEGTGDITVRNIMTDHIEAITSGTGDITLAGSCKSSKFTDPGTGDINSKRLKTIK